MSGSADVRGHQSAHAAGMTYVLTVKNQEATIEEYQKVVDTLAVDRPDGLLARYAGQDDGLVIVSVWESKAHSDRFASEHLMPALEAVRGPDAPSRQPTVFAFDAEDELA